jgi:hypothetical protein
MKGDAGSNSGSSGGAGEMEICGIGEGRKSMVEKSEYNSRK